MAQGECLDHEWKGGGREAIEGNILPWQIPSSQQKVVKFPGFVARQSEFEFSSSSNSY